MYTQPFTVSPKQTSSEQAKDYQAYKNERMKDITLKNYLWKQSESSYFSQSKATPELPKETLLNILSKSDPGTYPNLVNMTNIDLRNLIQIMGSNQAQPFTDSVTSSLEKDTKEITALANQLRLCNSLVPSDRSSLFYQTLVPVLLSNQSTYNYNQEGFDGHSSINGTKKGMQQLSLPNFIQSSSQLLVDGKCNKSTELKTARIRLLEHPPPNLSSKPKKSKKVRKEEEEEEVLLEEAMEEEEDEEGEEEFDEAFKPTKHCYYVTKNTIKEKRVLPARHPKSEPLEKADAHENPLEVIPHLVTKIGEILRMTDIDEKKVHTLLTKSEMDSYKVLTKVRRNLAYYRKNLKVDQPANG